MLLQDQDWEAYEDGVLNWTFAGPKMGRLFEQPEPEVLQKSTV